MARTSSRVRATFLVGAFVASAFAPVAAQAATPRVWCLQAYASTVPATKCDPSGFDHQAPADPDTVTPVSDLFGIGDESFFGSVVVEGNATPGSTVTITISDGTKSITRVATAAATPNAGANRRIGDFEILFDPAKNFSQTLLTIQELGTHETAPGADPATTTDPAQLGRTILTVTAIAEDGGGVSDPLSVDIVKLAATPGDTFAPRFTGLRFPPEHWCHYAGEGAQMPGGFSMGGGRDGTCSDFAESGFGALPDVTWILCVQETSTVPRQLPQGVAEIQRNLVAAWDEFCGIAMGCFGQQCTGFGGFSFCDPFCDEECTQDFADQYHSGSNNPRSQYCRTSPGRSFPRQEAPLQGQAIDHNPANGSLSSEIKSVTITINQGADVIRTYTDPIARNTSTSASWGISLKINDFAPTWPDGTPYTITVTAEDAWGNQASTTSNEINVYPY